MKEGKRIRGWVPRKLLKVVNPPQAIMASDCHKKVLSTDGGHADRTKQNDSTCKKDGDGRNVVSSVATKDGKKKKKKAHHKKQD